MLIRLFILIVVLNLTTKFDYADWEVYLILVTFFVFDLWSFKQGAEMGTKKTIKLGADKIKEILLIEGWSPSKIEEVFKKHAALMRNKKNNIKA